ncbi:beta-lactamase family protein [Marinilongibacter aquaticus]|uniref:serine hydrolase domain-containing protein n=1 Tax=Marinilongibacter aquaticus TaxID=2975157 RepID=UPI0021BD8DAB|nr:serine hydrolase domain-containing protein [Marinilongibacter aquaticus]UBM58781.1 beta-lactamase family protein [Marinilongibacter aquaticus]
MNDLIFCKLQYILIIIWFAFPSSIRGQSFDQSVNAYFSQLRLPAVAVAIAYEDSLIYFNSIGVANGESIGPNHIFGIASVTKTMSAVALEKAIASGELHWDDKIDKFPNKYFTPARWDSRTTLGHLFSMTADSEPPGTNFLYNGSKFNIPFNAFQVLNNADTSINMVARFTYEIDHSILYPLKMNHTINRFDEVQMDSLSHFLVPPYAYIDSLGKYQLQDFNFKSINSGPAFGMMSSVNDLVTYSNALDDHTLLTKDQFATITHPYYAGSPYGLGWFTSKIEGLNVFWAYGYGDNDAAILLKVPEKKLTFILLSASSMPSESSRMGYGYPLNSVLVISFVKNYLLKANDQEIEYGMNVSEILRQVKEYNQRNHTDFFVKELYAKASLGLLLRESLMDNREQARDLLYAYLKLEGRGVEIQSPLIFELLEKCPASRFDRCKKLMIHKYKKSRFFHPVTAVIIGNMLDEAGKTSKAIKYYKSVADGDAYRESNDKFFAMMWLAKYYKNRDFDLSEDYLKRVIKYKENISAKDFQYQEAVELLSQKP